MNIGPYELRGELGRGAMARVWRAWDPKLERDVAIKEPLFDGRLTTDVIGEMSARFVKEGMAAARLNHPGIVTIFAAEVFDGRPVIIMELIDGVTLSEVLRAGALSPRVTLDILDQLLDAVGYAHSQGVVHRDIKPDNIFITRDGRVKLSDFGIARIEDGSQTKATQFGTVLGTPGYMAPEQATGSPVDNRTDLFAIGTIAYEMLIGKNPFGAGEGTDSTTLLYRIVHQLTPELPDIVSEGLPADIRPAIVAALNKNPLDRPQDAASYKAMLHGAPAPITSTIYEYHLPESPKSTNSRKLLPYVLVGGVGVAAVALIFLFATSGTGGNGYGMGTDAQSPPEEILILADDDEQLHEARSEEKQENDANLEPDLPYRVFVSDVEGEVLRIRELWNTDRAAIDAGAYEISILANGVTAYSSGGVLRMIEVTSGTYGVNYMRIHQYENGQLIFSYYESSDQIRLYYKDNQLFRWRYTDTMGNVVNYDNDFGNALFLDWEIQARDEATRLKYLF